MKILKLLNKKSFLIIIFFCLSTNVSLSEDQPVDIWNIEEKQKIEDDFTPLKEKQKEIERHCRRDLSPRKLQEDECAAIKKYEDLEDEQKELRRKM